MSEKQRASIRATVDEISVNAAGVKLASLVTDDGDELVVPLALLPPGSHDGDVLLVRFERDADATAAVRRRVTDLQRRLFG